MSEDTNDQGTEVAEVAEAEVQEPTQAPAPAPAPKTESAKLITRYEDLPELGPCLVHISLIQVNPMAIRSVNRKNAKFLELVDSIASQGLLQGVLCRHKVDEETNESVLQLTDGLHRITACKDAGVTDIVVNIINADDARVLEQQVVGNMHHIPTSPAAYGAQLLKMMAFDAKLTVPRLAAKLGVDPSWVAKRLSLQKIDDEAVRKLVDDGHMTLANAVSLAKLPSEEQADRVEDAMTLSPKEFGSMVAARVQEIKEARATGRAAAPVEFKATAHVRKIKEIKAELGLEGENPGAAGRALIEELGIQTPAEAFKAAVQWVMNLDAPTVAQAREKWEAKQKEKIEAKTKRDAVNALRKKKKAEEQIEKATKEGREAIDRAAQVIPDFDPDLELARIEKEEAEKKAKKEAEKAAKEAAE
jgi:ParB/RepB/Spo0J family partition protein